MIATCGGINVQCPVFAEDDRGRCILIELVSRAPQKTRAIWAQIAKDGYKARSHTGVSILPSACEAAGGLKLFDHHRSISVFVGDGHRLVKDERTDEDGLHRIVLFDERFLRNSRELIMDGPDRLAHFGEFLSNKTDIPFLPEWLGNLWDMATRLKLVTGCDGAGAKIHQCSKGEKWNDVLLAATYHLRKQTAA
jgi:hypothetical protein